MQTWKLVAQPWPSRPLAPLQATEDARKAPGLCDLTSKGYIDLIYVNNKRQQRAGFQLQNKLETDGCNHDNSYFGSASLDLQREMDGGDNTLCGQHCQHKRAEWTKGARQLRMIGKTTSGRTGIGFFARTQHAHSTGLNHCGEVLNSHQTQP